MKTVKLNSVTVGEEKKHEKYGSSWSVQIDYDDQQRYGFLNREAMEWIKDRGGKECPIREVDKPKKEGEGVWHNFELKDIDILKFGLIGAFKRISALEERLVEMGAGIPKERKETEPAITTSNEPTPEPPIQEEQFEQDDLPF